jgi:hypothetical protein
VRLEVQSRFTVPCSGINPFRSVLDRAPDFAANIGFGAPGHDPRTTSFAHSCRPIARPPTLQRACLPRREEQNGRIHAERCRALCVLKVGPQLKIFERDDAGSAGLRARFRNIGACAVSGCPKRMGSLIVRDLIALFGFSNVRFSLPVI